MTITQKGSTVLVGVSLNVASTLRALWARSALDAAQRSQHLEGRIPNPNLPSSMVLTLARFVIRGKRKEKLSDIAHSGMGRPTTSCSLPATITAGSRPTRGFGRAPHISPDSGIGKFVGGMSICLAEWASRDARMAGRAKTHVLGETFCVASASQQSGSVAQTGILTQAVRLAAEQRNSAGEELKQQEFRIFWLGNELHVHGVKFSEMEVVGKNKMPPPMISDVGFTGLSLSPSPDSPSLATTVLDLEVKTRWIPTLENSFPPYLFYPRTWARFSDKIDRTRCAYQGCNGGGQT
ncbi:hypothetical protein B0H14DRAFT_2599031 [Mycena olivaceomarginata]|nr:hypothetical protein B0H14DRAFT_2599031 [Mycena olivaceomarginata]